MKIKAEKKIDFTPVVVEVSLESPEEVQRFYAIFNHQRISDFLGSSCGDDMMRSMELVHKGAYSKEIFNELEKHLKEGTT